MKNGKPATILTLTLNPCIDRSASVQKVVAERKLRCEEVAFHPGGGGINVARAIRYLGGEARAFWTKGGPIGDLLDRMLDEDSIDHSPIPINSMTRENFIITEKSGEQQFRFGMPGAELSEGEADRILELISEWSASTGWMVLSGSLPPGVPDDFYGRLAKGAHGARIVLDTSGEALRKGLENGVYLLKPNLAELGTLAGRQIEGDDEILEVSRDLIKKGLARVVMTTLGAGGAIVVSGDLEERIESPTVKIRSKIGAGDSTVAGVVLGLQRGLPLGEAARFGVASGAAAVKTEGTELCRREDAERLYKEICAEAS